MPRRNRYKQRKDGRYGAKVYLGHDEHGKLKSIQLYANSSLELEKMVDKMRNDYKQGLVVNTSKITLEEYAKKWFETYKSVKAINTKAMYKNIIEKHIIYDLGHKALEDISKSDIQKMINDRAEHRRTCEQIKITMKQILDSAVEDEIIKKNVCTGITLPKAKGTKKRALTDIEKKALSKANFTLKEKALIYVVYGCGLRRGETLALTRNDINLKERYISVNKTVVFDGNNPVLSQPKTAAGIRKVDMPNFLISFFKDYFKQHHDLYIITMKNGNLVTKSSYDNMWSNIVKKINLAAGGNESCNVIHGLTYYTFRHNYCTTLYYSGISLKKAAQLMGHADIKMIMEVYAHLDEEQEQAREKINKLLVI